MISVSQPQYQTKENIHSNIHIIRKVTQNFLKVKNVVVTMDNSYQETPMWTISIRKQTIEENFSNEINVCAPVPLLHSLCTGHF